MGGDLETTAGMLSCGEASAPALDVLLRRGIQAVTVSEERLEEAPAIMRDCGGPSTTTSGAASLAGALATRERLLTPGARVLLLVTEGEVVG